MSARDDGLHGAISLDPATVVTSSTGDKRSIYILKPITVHEIGLQFTVATTTTAIVVAFDRRVLTGSDTGRGTGDVGILTEPSIGACAIGKTIKKLVNVDLATGDEIVVEVTTASAAGTCRPYILYRVREENPANETDTIVSV